MMKSAKFQKVASKAATEPRLQMFQIPKIRGYKVLKKRRISVGDNFERERQLKVEKPMLKFLLDGYDSAELGGFNSMLFNSRYHAV